MRLISARQAWHDCMAVTTTSPLARAAEIARYGREIQNTAWHDSNNRALHIAQAGKVLNAIATLPLELQQVGHWLYAPLTTIEQDDLAEAVQDAIWCRSGLAADLPEKHRHNAYWLIRAVMRDFQDAVLDRPLRLQTPQAIRGWLADWHGVQISSAEEPKWWVRVYKPIWGRLWVALDEMDAQALAPVGRVIEAERKKKGSACGSHVDAAAVG